MKKFAKSVAIIIVAVILLSAIPTFVSAKELDLPTVSYSTHISNIGWINSVSNGATAGNDNINNNLEAIKVDLQTKEDIDVSCGVHVSNIGWMNEVSNGQTAGTTGRALSVEGIYFYLTGADSEKYDIWYRTNIEKFGWLGWAKNGEKSGSQGLSLPVHQIEIKITVKSSFEPKNSVAPFETALVSYSSHLSNLGWTNTVYDGQTSGVAINKYNIEALKINVISNDNIKLNCGIHIANIGWIDNISSNNIIGTTGKALSAEGLYLSIVGENAEKYDVWYHSYIDKLGWLGWAKNGEYSGSQGLSIPLKAIEIKICPKDTFNPENTENAFVTKMFIYSSHVSDIGWMGSVTNGATSGTADNTHKIEAVSVSALGYGDLHIKYAAHVSNIGWMGYVCDGKTAGTTGRALSVESMYFELYGKEAQKYDIWYRSYIHGKGWLSWTSNGQKSGSVGKAIAMSGIQIVICEKGKFALDDTNGLEAEKGVLTYSAATSKDNWTEDALSCEVCGNLNEANPLVDFKAQISGEIDLGISYSVCLSSNGWADFVSDGNTFDGLYENIEAISIELTGAEKDNYDIYYSVCTENYGWLGWAKNGDCAGNEGVDSAVYAVTIRICKKNTFVQPYFGDAFVIKDEKLYGDYLFAIDAGHGGSDVGATGIDGRYEADDNLKVAQEVIRVLNQQGQKTYFIDRNITAANRPLEANEVNATILVSLHRDSTEAKNGPSGISLYTHEPNHIQRQQQPTKAYSPNEQENRHEFNELLVNNLKNNLTNITSTPVRDPYYGSAQAPTWEDYYINRLANMPSCIIELGYVNNATDNSNFDNYYREYAKAIAKSLMQTVGLKFDENKYTLE